MYIRNYLLSLRFFNSGYQGLLAILSLLVLTINTGVWAYDLWRGDEMSQGLQTAVTVGRGAEIAHNTEGILEQTLLIKHDLDSLSQEIILENAENEPKQTMMPAQSLYRHRSKAMVVNASSEASEIKQIGVAAAVETENKDISHNSPSVSDDEEAKSSISLFSMIKKLIWSEDNEMDLVGDEGGNEELEKQSVSRAMPAISMRNNSGRTLSADGKVLISKPSESTQKYFLNNGVYRYTVAEGDTLASLLNIPGIDRAAAHLIAKSVDRVYKLSQLRPGYKVAIKNLMPIQEKKQVYDKKKSALHSNLTLYSSALTRVLSISINNVKIFVNFDSKKREYLAELEKSASKAGELKIANKSVMMADAQARSNSEIRTGGIIGRDVARDKAIRVSLANSEVNQQQLSSNSSNNAKHEVLVAANVRERFVQGRIEGSFARSAAKKGVPAYIIAQSQKLFNNINISKGNFRIIYDNNEKSENALVYAAIDNIYGQTILKVYRHRVGNKVRYSNQNGLSLAIANAVASSGLKTPLRNAVVCSEYGMRFHPKLKRHRIHKGIDYKAQRGSLIMAAGDGVIRNMGYNRGYGYFVKIQHNDRIHSTLYAHMEKFAPHIRIGQEVRQGETIGFVGSSGLSTGAHLHFEVHKNGIQINPRVAFDLYGKNGKKQQSQLPVGHMRSFMAEKQRIDRLLDENTTLYTANRN